LPKIHFSIPKKENPLLLLLTQVSQILYQIEGKRRKTRVFFIRKLFFIQTSQMREKKFQQNLFQNTSGREEKE